MWWSQSNVHYWQPHLLPTLHMIKMLNSWWRKSDVWSIGLGWVWEVKCYINTHLCDLNMWHSHQPARETDTIHWKYLHLELFTLTWGTAGTGTMVSTFSTKLHLRWIKMPLQDENTMVISGDISDWPLENQNCSQLWREGCSSVAVAGPPPHRSLIRAECIPTIFV